ncbi:MAG: tRNA (cytidine(34)-2'-O)-methyltransferase [Myxococcales bacterium]|nr:tRNA (cytidine(34)-2'-O)-methyltransferase [Myxococcales bacterium]MDH3486174.1 tRNA (cytidine(34)-2'-O)-methyltransferase [Myxococcales bacterium]
MPQGPKLRVRPLETPFLVVLVEPEIPPNTGAIARTCAATGSPLHLVGRLGFSIDEHAVRRAGLDYWNLVEIHRHESFSAFEESNRSGRIHFFSGGAPRSYLEADFKPGDALVFGRESVGLPEALLAGRDRVWAIPTLAPVRSLNLSNAVGIVLYEALRQNQALNDTFLD